MTLYSLLALTFTALIVATALGQTLRCLVRSDGARVTVANANLRIGAWWVLCAIFGLASLLGSATVLAVFALFSCLAVREFAAITGAPARQHYTAVILTLAQYAFVWTGWYTPFSVLIPVSAIVVLPLVAILRGEDRFLERTAVSAWALAICTYGVSHAPALLMLPIRGFEGRSGALLFYFLLIVQSSDVFQYCWGKLLGRTPIAPRISPHKTWEGFAGGVLSATALGASLYRATPFDPLAAAGISLLVTLAGFAGGLVLSAVKRDRGVKDFGAILPGHGGVLDRLDSICLSAPVFFYLVRYFYAV